MSDADTIRRAIDALHFPEEWLPPDAQSSRTRCAECHQEWPCRTVRALAECSYESLDAAENERLREALAEIGAKAKYGWECEQLLRQPYWTIYQVALAAVPEERP